MTNPFHAANRLAWDAAARCGRGQVDTAGVSWRDALRDPRSLLLPEELGWLGDVAGRQVCVLGSGDNRAVFALAGLGAHVTSVDISGEQLRIAAARADEAGVEVRFVRADVTDLAELGTETFDCVYTGGHVAVWVSDLAAYYREAVRILRPGGVLLVNEYHPFRRGICPGAGPAYRYFAHGPFAYDKAAELPGAAPGTLPGYEFQWTVGDFVTAVLHAGAELVELREIGDEPEAWETVPLAGLPRCLLLLARKRGKHPCETACSTR